MLFSPNSLNNLPSFYPFFLSKHTTVTQSRRAQRDALSFRWLHKYYHSSRCGYVNSVIDNEASM